MDFKVRCTYSCVPSLLTKGDIYEVKNGKITYDNGHLSSVKVTSVADMNEQYVSQFELVREENEMFAKSDIKVGYVVEHTNGELAIISVHADSKMCVAKSVFTVFDEINDDLTGIGFDGKYGINKVYGYSNSIFKPFEISKTNRELLWERKPETVELTLAQIADKFGVPVESLRVKE